MGQREFWSAGPWWASGCAGATAGGAAEQEVEGMRAEVLAAAQKRKEERRQGKQADTSS